jgi:hypothetical protein
MNFPEMRHTPHRLLSHLSLGKSFWLPLWGCWGGRRAEWSATPRNLGLLDLSPAAGEGAFVTLTPRTLTFNSGAMGPCSLPSKGSFEATAIAPWTGAIYSLCYKWVSHSWMRHQPPPHSYPNHPVTVQQSSQSQGISTITRSWIDTLLSINTPGEL